MLSLFHAPTPTPCFGFLTCHSTETRKPHSSPVTRKTARKKDRKHMVLIPQMSTTGLIYTGPAFPEAGYKRGECGKWWGGRREKRKLIGPVLGENLAVLPSEKISDRDHNVPGLSTFWMDTVTARQDVGQTKYVLMKHVKQIRSMASLFLTAVVRKK